MPGSASRQADRRPAGPRPHRKCMDRLMKRLGYAKLWRSGDWGDARHGADGSAGTSELLGIHTKHAGDVPATFKGAPARRPAAIWSLADEQHAYDQLDFFYKNGLAYALEMANRPQTLYGIADSPAGPGAWILDSRRAQLRVDVTHLSTERLKASREMTSSKHHALLVDEHSCLFGSSLLVKTSWPFSSQEHHHPGRRKRLSTSSTSPAQLGRAGLSQAHHTTSSTRPAFRRVGTADLFSSSSG